MTDLPLIQPFPNGTPTDDESEADRDRQHAKDVAADRAAWNSHDDWPIREVTI